MLLPNEYQEVEWIGTTGTQYIDTGIFPGTNIQVETKITVQSTAQEKTVFGNYKSSTTGSYLYYHLTSYQNAWYYGINGSESHAGSYSPVIGTQYEIVYNNENNQLSVNGTEVGSTSGTQGQSGSTLYISARGTTNACYGYYNYYTFNVFNKTTGEYERQMIPCYRKSDGVIGMYDLVNDVFYTNDGTGTFTKGADINGYKVKRALLWTNNPDSRGLPSAYQEVDYIQCSGTQWIDTGYTYTNPNKIKYELSYNLTASPDEFSYFGSRVQPGTGNGYSGIPFGGGIYSNTTAFGSIATSTNTNYVLSVEFTPSSNKSNIVQYTNGTKTYDQTYTNSSYMPPTQTQHIGLFCDINGSGSAIQLASMKAYSFKIWDTDILVRDFVPCYRKSDSVIGMYDLVNDVFYTNSGTGTFTKGNDVPSLVENIIWPSTPAENWILFDETDYKNSVPSKNGKFHYTGWGSASYWTNIGYDTANGRIYSTNDHSLGQTSINANSELVNAKKIKFICDYLYCYNYNTYQSGTNFFPFTMQMAYNFSVSLWDQTTSNPAIGSVVTHSTPYSAEFYYDLEADSGTLTITNLNTQAVSVLDIASFNYTWNTYLAAGNLAFSIWKDQGHSSYMGDVHLYYTV